MKKKVIFFDNTEHFNLKQIKIKKREKEKSVLIQNYKRVCVCECVYSVHLSSFQYFLLILLPTKGTGRHNRTERKWE
jgi:hypothetical protein